MIYSRSHTTGTGILKEAIKNGRNIVLIGSKQLGKVYLLEKSIRTMKQGKVAFVSLKGNYEQVPKALGEGIEVFTFTLEHFVDLENVLSELSSGNFDLVVFDSLLFHLTAWNLVQLEGSFPFVFIVTTPKGEIRSAQAFEEFLMSNITNQEKVEKLTNMIDLIFDLDRD